MPQDEWPTVGSGPPAGFVKVGAYDLLVDAAEVVGPLADEMKVWCQGRMVPTGDGSTPTDLEAVQIWVPEADAEQARRILLERWSAPSAPGVPSSEPPHRTGALGERVGSGARPAATAVSRPFPRTALVILALVAAVSFVAVNLQRCG